MIEFFLLYFFFVIALAVSWFVGYYRYKLAQESHNWPVVTGTITQCQLRRYESARLGTSYSVEVSYTYKVGGKLYSSHVCGWGEDPFTSLWEKKMFVAKHPDGTPITVHYKPSAPQTAALFISPFPAWLSILLVLIFVFLLFILLLPLIIALVILIRSSAIN